MTIRLTRSPLFGVFALAFISIVSAPAYGQLGTEADIDRLVDASHDDASTLLAAETQVQAGDLTAAATTLERRLIVEPDATSVRVRYLTLLCELDDRQAAAYELGKLASEPLADSARASIQSKCGDLRAATVN